MGARGGLGARWGWACTCLWTLSGRASGGKAPSPRSGISLLLAWITPLWLTPKCTPPERSGVARAMNARPHLVASLRDASMDEGLDEAVRESARRAHASLAAATETGGDV